jgi:hypothetical protein
LLGLSEILRILPLDLTAHVADRLYIQAIARPQGQVLLGREESFDHSDTLGARLGKQLSDGQHRGWMGPIGQVGAFRKARGVPGQIELEHYSLALDQASDPANLVHHLD